MVKESGSLYFFKRLKWIINKVLKGMDWKGDILKIEIKEEISCEETQINIVCSHMDSSILKILAMLRSFDRKITGIKGGETYLLEAYEILYIDTADKKIATGYGRTDTSYYGKWRDCDCIKAVCASN